MSLLQMQDVVVALTALGAAAVVARRVIGFAAPETSPKCSNCASSACAPSSHGSPAAPAPSASPAAPVARPLVFIRSSRH